MTLVPDVTVKKYFPGLHKTSQMKSSQIKINASVTRINGIMA